MTPSDEELEALRAGPPSLENDLEVIWPWHTGAEERAAYAAHRARLIADLDDENIYPAWAIVAYDTDLAVIERAAAIAASRDIARNGELSVRAETYWSIAQDARRHLERP